MSLLISKLISLSILMLVALPFGQIFHFRLGFVTLNLFEVLYIVIIMLSLALATINGVRRRFAVLLVLWLFISVIYILVSPIISNVSIAQSVVHYRFYLPFLAAIMILAVPIKGDVGKFSRLLVLAAIMSSGLALLIHFVFPEIIRASFSHVEDVSEIILMHGRLYWSNALVVLFVVSMFFSASGRTSANKIALLFVLFASIATMNRTILIGLVVIMLAMFINNREVKLSRRISTLLAALIGFFGIFVSLYVYNEKFSSLVDLRVFGRGDIRVVYENAVLGNRDVLYGQYINSLLNYFPFGQGLGRPFASDIQSNVFTTDISLLSFTLPFGDIGLLLFVYFIFTLNRVIADFVAISQFQRSVKTILSVLFFAFLVVSFNVDVFSRNNAVVWFAMLVNFMYGHSISNRAKL